MPATFQTAEKADKTVSSWVDGGSPVVRRVNVLRSTFEFIIGTVVVILLLELLFAWAGVGEQEYLCSDPDLGYAHMKGKALTWRSEGFSRTQFNSQGMRDVERPYAKAPGTYRIAILGDSWVEALQVERDKGFCSVLEKMLNERARVGGSANASITSTPAKFEVLNFGVAAYNLAQNYLQLKKRVLQYDPDLVITAFRADSSLLLVANPAEGFLYARPNFFVDGKGGLIEDKTVQNMWLASKSGKRMEETYWLRRNSRIWGIYSRCAEALTTWTRAGGFRPAAAGKLITQKAGDAGGEEEVIPLDKNYVIKGKPGGKGGKSAGKDKKGKGKGTVGDTWPEADVKAEGASKFLWPIASALLTDMNAECRKHGCEFMVVRLPGPNGYDNKLENACLKESASTLHVPFVDMTEPFRDRLREGANLFFLFHTNEEGHRLIAERIYSAIPSEKR